MTDLVFMATPSRCLLCFFLLDKAFMEVEYELLCRPDRRITPLTGVLRILSETEDEAVGEPNG
ncbi:MAG: hypothetical protein FWD68_20565 [Alphaproteobacteria bacterium]|nr:hypothetical protein [Alphaproteobacteria bacterium]